MWMVHGSQMPSSNLIMTRAVDCTYDSFGRRTIMTHPDETYAAVVGLVSHRIGQKPTTENAA